LLVSKAFIEAGKRECPLFSTLWPQNGGVSPDRHNACADRWCLIPGLRARQGTTKLSAENPSISDFAAVGNPVHNDVFPVTRHSVLLAMRSDDPAQRKCAAETIAATYWKPIYKYVRLKWNLECEAAQDFTQEFLLRLIEKDFLDSFDPAKARLRTFLRTCADRLYLNQVRDAQRQKRNGGTAIPLDFDEAEQEFAKRKTPASPEAYFEKECVRHLLSLAVERLRAKCESSGKAVHFKIFHDYDLDHDADTVPSYSKLAAKYQLPATDVTNYLAWARREFRACVLQQLREMSATDEEFRREAKSILGINPK